mmetsp:Transcript_43005/g.141236  ORF Transcript_43005/g.141236 Transcript_43005/m.141236 type:complete len:291 (+) Transcript_43005:693-1565(+)
MAPVHSLPAVKRRRSRPGGSRRDEAAARLAHAGEGVGKGDSAEAALAAAGEGDRAGGGGDEEGGAAEPQRRSGCDRPARRRQQVACQEVWQKREQVLVVCAEVDKEGAVGEEQRGEGGRAQLGDGGQQEAPEGESEEEPGHHLRLRLEELERQRAEGESVQAVGEEVVCVVEGLEEEVGGDQLAELVAAACGQCGARQVARDEAKGRHHDGLEEGEHGRPDGDDAFRPVGGRVDDERVVHDNEVDERRLGVVQQRHALPRSRPLARRGRRRGRSLLCAAVAAASRAGESS